MRRQVCIRTSKRLGLWLRPLALFCVLLSSVLMSFAVGAEGFAGYSGSSWRSRDGAPVDISEISQTTDGWIWLGTSSGLYRFDGRSFSRFDAIPDEAAGTRLVSALTATADGGLWVVFGRALIARVEPGARRAWVPQGLPAEGLGRVVVDGANRTFVSADRRYFELVDGQWVPLTAGEWTLPSGAFIASLIDADGGLLVSTSDGVFRLGAGAHAFVRIADGTNEDEDLFADEQGRPWRTHLRTIEMLSAAPVRVWPGAARNPAIATVDAAGALWHISGGLTRRAAGTAGIGPVASQAGGEVAPEGSMARMVMTLMQDTAGNVWVGCKEGLERFQPNAAAAIDFGFPKYYFAPVALPTGAMWVGTDSHGGADHVWEVAGTTSSVSVDGKHPVTSAMLDGDGSVLAGGHGTLSRYIDGRLEALPFPANLDGELVQQLVREPAGRLWASVRAKGLFEIRDGNWIQNGDVSGVPSAAPLVGALDPQHNVLFGYADGAVWTVMGKTAHALAPGGASAVGAVTALDPGTPLLIGGERGVAWFDGTRFRSLHLRMPDVLTGVTGLVRMPSGDLWANARGGLVRVAADDLKRAISNADYELPFSLIDEDHGLPGGAQQTRPLPTLVRDHEGKLWAAGSYGLAVVTPDAPVRPAPVAAALVSAQVMSTPLDPFVARTLASWQSTLSFSFTGLSLADPKHVAYRYRLVGTSEAWQESGDGGPVQYTNLGPGTYRFEVQARGPSGDWSPVVSSAPFRRLPAFYQTVWFVVLMGLVFVAILWLAFTTRVATLQRRARERAAERVNERDRIARDLHDSMLQGVQGLALRLQAWQVDRRASPPLQAELAQAADRVAALLLEGRARIVGLRSSGAERIPLADALDMIGRDHAATYGARFALAVMNLPEALDEPTHSTLVDVISEAIHNAFVHGRPRVVRVTLDFDEGAVIAIIDDDGEGVPADVLAAGHRQGHWGLVNMRERAAAVGGALDVSSDSSGTVVSLKVPAALPSPDGRVRRLVRWLARRDGGPGPV